jgi:putative FmdB family regulatory protein
MPVYEYVCQKCKARFDRVKSFRVSDKTLDNDKCDKCGGKAKLVPSIPGHPILVGAGFHCNDYNAPTR